MKKEDGSIPVGSMLMLSGDCPEAMFRNAVNSFLFSIEEIDKVTPWQNTEPNWWLAMMDMQRFINKTLDDFSVR